MKRSEVICLILALIVVAVAATGYVLKRRKSKRNKELLAAALPAGEKNRTISFTPSIHA